MEKLSDLIEYASQLQSEVYALRAKLDNDQIRNALRFEMIYESNKIEGNTLTLRETQMVIEKGLTVGGKSLVEHLEATNHQEAILFVEDIVSQKVDFSERVLKQIHGLILHGIDRENAGIYRKVPVLISGSKHIPPQPYLIDSLMESYFHFYEAQKQVLHPIDLAAEMHERLASIHPFIDGNGRTSRLIMNLILLQHHYPLAIIAGEMSERLEYY
jgi:Fic family protein